MNNEDAICPELNQGVMIIKELLPFESLNVFQKVIGRFQEVKARKMSTEAEKVVEKEQKEVAVEAEAEKKVEGSFMWRGAYK